MSLALLFHYLLLNMFRMLIHPSSGACNLFVELFHGLYCSGTMCVGVTVWFGWSGVVSLCRLKCFSLHKARDIKLVSLYSTIKMMHGPINVRCLLTLYSLCCLAPFVPEGCWLLFLFFISPCMSDFEFKCCVITCTTLDSAKDIIVCVLHVM